MNPTVSSIGLSMVSGFGGLLSFYIPDYSAAGADYADITALMTYPSMFMGIGNIISVPIALAIGRRPVFMFSTLLLIFSAVLCAFAKDYTWHFSARLVLGLAAGQSEALVPLMVQVCKLIRDANPDVTDGHQQEIHFLHERSHTLMLQSATQTILSAVLVLCASPIAGAITPRYWYILGAGVTVLQFILSIFFVPETKYERPLSAYQANDMVQWTSAGGNESGEVLAPVTTSTRPPLDLINHQPRTVLSDMRLFVGPADWKQAYYTLKVSAAHLETSNH